MTADPAEPSIDRGSRFRFLITPKWLAFHLLVAIVVFAMFTLALWQLRRLDERAQFNEHVRANANQPIASFDDVGISTEEPSTTEWRRVRVTGAYVTRHQFFVVNRSQNGNTGRNVVDALQLSDGSLLLVNRGFVSSVDDVPPAPEGTIELVGRLRVSERRSAGQAADEGANVLTEIRRIDIPVLATQFDENVLPMYVEQLESNPPDAPSLQPIVAPTLDEGPHLSYTIQWFIFSICVVAGWVLAVRRSMAIRSGKIVKRRSDYVPIAEQESRS